MNRQWYSRPRPDPIAKWRMELHRQLRKNSIWFAKDLRWRQKYGLDRGVRDQRLDSLVRDMDQLGVPNDFNVRFNVNTRQREPDAIQSHPLASSISDAQIAETETVESFQEDPVPKNSTAMDAEVTGTNYVQTAELVEDASIQIPELLERLEANILRMQNLVFTVRHYYQNT